MLFAVDRAPTFRQALFLGWWAGVVETAGGFYWLIDVMRRFAAFPWIAAAPVFLISCMARRHLPAVHRHRLRHPPAKPRADDTARAVGDGQLRTRGAATVSLRLRISQAQNPHVIQIAELTGPLGVTALLMTVNGAIYDLAVDGSAARYPAMAARRCSRQPSSSACAGHAPDRRHRGPGAALRKIGLVQPNFAYTMDTDDFPRRGGARVDRLGKLESCRCRCDGAKLLVWERRRLSLRTRRRDFAADFAP